MKRRLKQMGFELFLEGMQGFRRINNEKNRSTEVVCFYNTSIEIVIQIVMLKAILYDLSCVLCC